MRLFVAGLAITVLSSISLAKVSFVAFGDAPYFGPPSWSMLDKLIEQTNKIGPDFVVHIGDIGAGEPACQAENDQKILTTFARFKAPVIYTPGDNEWTDCHRESAGSRDPLSRLEAVREAFFTKPQSLGQNPIAMEVQGSSSEFKKFVENRRWAQQDILFLTLHVVGSDNNRRPEDKAAMNEYTERTAANLAWLSSSLQRAQEIKAKATVIFFHADLRLDKPQEGLTPEALAKYEEGQLGYRDTAEAIKQFAKSFGGPVLGVHGDFHSFRVDQPMTEKNEWEIEWPLDNFTRLEVFGAPDVRGVLVRVDTSKDQPFSIEPMPAIAWEYPIEEDSAD